MTDSPRTIPAIAVVGPTASGKSALGLWMAEQGYPIEIISMDSALVFRHMNIGTAKPTASELAMAPHHLIDLIDPDQSYNAADFIRDCERLVDDIRNRGKVPVILGGTMMYFKALISGIDDLPPADNSIRDEIEQFASLHGWPAVHEELSRVDPLTAARLKPNDSQRLQRALEVYRLTGRGLSAFHQRELLPPRLLPTLAVEPGDRSILHQRIHARFLNMLEQGFIDEVRTLRQQFRLDPAMPSVRCVGYRQAWDYLDGGIDHATFIEKGVAATRQLAKRQITWLRSTPNKTSIDPLQVDWLSDVRPWLEKSLESVLQMPSKA